VRGFFYSGRTNVNPNFAEFYIEQVKLGAITVDKHGENKAVFYGTSKEYLGESELLSDPEKSNIDFSSKSGQGRAIDYLNSTASRVAMVYLDYEADGKGDHFVVAYKDSQGEWRLRDHNVKEGGSKVGDDLFVALDRNEIKDIRLVH
jgi:hypothetical protein